MSKNIIDTESDNIIINSEKCKYNYISNDKKAILIKFFEDGNSIIKSANISTAKSIISQYKKIIVLYLKKNVVEKDTVY